MSWLFSLASRSAAVGVCCPYLPADSSSHPIAKVRFQDRFVNPKDTRVGGKASKWCRHQHPSLMQKTRFGGCS
ncbi:hypothetical protein PoMZ_13153 [Pyricularia oryzae]|uniref:Uncharacterized protein n=1 Tax=Pyricularia oryzae TaxID=318829 RepID=A0A4P7NUM5_PYROR|nr:hypothetical protein PoMZ_13153 [Pyricularia oryzae]